MSLLIYQTDVLEQILSKEILQTLFNLLLSKTLPTPGLVGVVGQAFDKLWIWVQERLAKIMKYNITESRGPKFN